jgi:hypothetical protein
MGRKNWNTPKVTCLTEAFFFSPQWPRVEGTRRCLVVANEKRRPHFRRIHTNRRHCRHCVEFIVLAALGWLLNWIIPVFWVLTRLQVVSDRRLGTTYPIFDGQAFQEEASKLLACQLLVYSVREFFDWPYDGTKFVCLLLSISPLRLIVTSR